MFNCLCQFSKPISQQREILHHIDGCPQFNQDSPLCRMMQRANFTLLTQEQLITFKCDLQLQLQRIDKLLIDVEEPNIMEYGRYTSRIEIQQSNIMFIEKQDKPQEIKQSPQMQIEIQQQQQQLQEQQQQHQDQNQFQEEIVPQKQQKEQIKTPIMSPLKMPIIQATLMIEESQPTDSKLICEACRKVFYSNKDFDKLWYLDQCCHMICRMCISRLAIDYVLNDGKLLCPELGCGAKFTMFDLQSVLGNEKFQELDRKLAMKNSNVVECCKCKNVFSFEKGSDQEMIKDEKGRQISGVELMHYISNRFKCQSCNTDQCRACHATPYHANATCETFKTNQLAQKCRLCEQPTKGDPSLGEAFRSICDAEDCQRRMKSLCGVKLGCGHFCCGIVGEECICLDVKCSGQQSEDDYCNLCFTEALKSAPCVRSKCGHIFHEECLVKRLQAKWNGPRIVFNFCNCPLCNQMVQVNSGQITPLLKRARELKEEVQILCLERLKIEKMNKAKELSDPKHQFYKNEEGFSMHVFCFYECFKCKKPYFGGLKNCQAAAEQDNRVQFNKEDLICPECCPISFENKCPKHGNKYIEFKCRFCCSIALWFCGGTTHYCEPCHNGSNQKMNQACPGPQKCPLGVAHKPNGQECALGCAVCRSKRMDEILKQKE